ncbi:MAG: LysR family transcriptional regulator [Hyphomicrobiaceae bacterium]|nr:LysR family transcriptional regulator [Hyphomicrobiaceae bacterium]
MAGSLKDIRLFVAAYEERSFTTAAQREHSTQSGVSQHIRKLELALGVQLFSRDKGQITPTPAGESYYQRCLDVLRTHEIATKAAKSYAKGTSGNIVVGLMPTMTRCMLAPVLNKFATDNPNTNIRIIEAYSAPLTQQVRAGELDFAIVPAFQGAPGLKGRLFLRTPEVLVGGKNAPWTHQSLTQLSKLGPLKLVLPSTINTRRQLIETYCSSNGIEITRMIEMDAMLGTLDFVARTDWMTILPGIMMAIDDPGNQFKVSPLSDPGMMLDLVLIEPSRRPMSPAAKLFLAMLQLEADRLNARWMPPNIIITTTAKQRVRHHTT